MIEKIAREVAAEVRTFVRDRFTPGSLSSLDELAKLVEEKVVDSHGRFKCGGCGLDIRVEFVKCGHCTDPIKAYD